MGAISVLKPFDTYYGNDGIPLENGMIYIGTANQNPETNPIAVYFDSALAIPASQPIRTVSGYPVYNGSPASLYADANDYSITVRDRNQSLIFTAQSSAILSSAQNVSISDNGGLLTADNVEDALQESAQEIVDNFNTLNQKIETNFVNVKDFGATGDGVTDDTSAVQDAIDSLAVSGGVVNFPPGTYRIARTVGVNDRWGIKVTASNITLKGEQATLRRFDTAISTYALAYPILFIGTPDSDVAAATDGTVVTGIKFQGEDVQHSVAGSHITDFRCSIVCKNTTNTLINGNTFKKIDSSAIDFEFPGYTDYANSVDFNKTKNYNVKVIGNSFYAEPHAVAGRALIHSLELRGVDGAIISGNYFYWCDSSVGGETTYNNFTDTEDDIYTGPGALGAIKRTGRDWTITGNNFFNASEHAAYISGMDVALTGNTFRTDEPSICNTDPIKIRGRGIVVDGNSISNYGQCIGINEPSIDVTVSGNVCRSRGTSQGAVIDVNSDGLSSYIANRTFLGTYLPMQNIAITGNTIQLPTAASADNVSDVAIRIYTDSSDANFPNGQIQGVVIADNTITNYNVGVYFIGSLIDSVKITGNTFKGKPFTRSGFSAGTTLNTRTVLQADISAATTSAMQYVSFSGNTVNGSTYLFTTSTGAGAAGTYSCPYGFNTNRLDYVKNIKTSDMGSISFLNNFTYNTGLSFLDRTYSNTMIGNALYSGSGTSERKYCMLYDGAVVRFFTDDASTYISL